MPRESKEQLSTAEKFENFTKRNLLLVAFFFTVSLITAVSTVITAVLSYVNWQNSRRDWRPAEYSKLTKLRAGQTYERFQDILGVPAYRERYPNGNTAIIFHPRSEYWVSTVVNPSNATLSYAVTSCSDEFRPTFQFRVGKTWARVTLNGKNLYSVLAGARENPSSYLKVHSMVATASEYAFQTYGGGNPTSYRVYAWGINDSCTPWDHQQTKNGLIVWHDWYVKYPSRKKGVLKIPVRELKGAGYQPLKESNPNTYAETAPFTGLDSVYPNQIGVDRITIRP